MLERIIVKKRGYFRPDPNWLNYAGFYGKTVPGSFQMRTLSKDLNGRQGNSVILDSLRFNRERLFNLTVVSTFGLLVLAILGILPIPANLFKDLLASGVSGKAAFGVIFTVCLAVSTVFYLGVALITRIVLQAKLRSAEVSFEKGDTASALAQYQACQRLIYFSLAGNSNMAYELQQRIHQLNSLPKLESK